MSGPKGYSTGISVSRLDGRLNEIIQLQAHAERVISSLPTCQIRDDDRNIRFDCRSFVSANEKRVKNLLVPATVPSSGTVNQGRFDSLNKLLEEKIQNLKTFIQAAEKEKQDFLAKKDDYECYLDYENCREAAFSEFECFKNRVLSYMKDYLAEEHSDILAEAQGAIQPIELNIGKTDFRYGFRNTVGQRKDKIKSEVRRCEGTINTVRASTSDRVLKACPQGIMQKKEVKRSLSKAEEGSRKKIEDCVTELETVIQMVDHAGRQIRYRERLDNLMQSETFQDAYFYIELLDEIKSEENVIRWKQGIKEKMAAINQLKVHEKCIAAQAALLQKASELIIGEKIKNYDMDDFESRCNAFYQENEAAVENECILERERLFIKAQLVRSLKDLNYKVITDAAVIDFETESDFLFQIPNQKNYLNLRFNSDGTFLYNFLIPDKTAELSIDQKKAKLNEMAATCDQFKQLMAELHALGLKVDLQTEKPVCEKALIQVPVKYRDKVQARNETVVAGRQERTRYIDR